MKYGEEKIGTDMAIVSIVVPAESIRTMVFIPVSVLDKIGLLGGSMGLFNGFAIVVIFEIVYWSLFLVYVLAASRTDRKSGARQKNVSDIKYNYKSSSTLHGSVYLEAVVGTKSMVYWGIAIAFVLIFGTYIVTFTMISMAKDPFTRTVLDSKKTSSEMAFPAITVCPVQIYDKWNLPRMLLNHVRVQCDNYEDCKAAHPLHHTFHSFFGSLLNHQWLSTDSMERHVTVDEDFSYRVRQFMSIYHFGIPLTYPLLGLKAKVDQAPEASKSKNRDNMISTMNNSTPCTLVFS